MRRDTGDARAPVPYGNGFWVSVSVLFASDYDVMFSKVVRKAV